LKAAANPPVSEFEAPKLKMAGKSQPFVANIGTVVVHKISTIKDTSGILLKYKSKYSFLSSPQGLM
jgi:hypothetical protein